MTASHLYAEEMALRGMKAGGGAGVAITAGLAAGALIHLTIAGAVSIQLRETTKGNDPRPMNDWRFWGAALMQGGGLGIFGDFLYAAQGRTGLTAPATAMGPIGQVVADAGNLTVGNIGQIAEGIDDGESLGEAVEGANVGRDVAQIVRRYNPLATLWWSRAVYSRAVADTIQRALDPEAEEAFQRQRKRLERETGQGQWWAAGETAPTRAPNLANAAGEPVS
jgi:hypothetical protein